MRSSWSTVPTSKKTWFARARLVGGDRGAVGDPVAEPHGVGGAKVGGPPCRGAARCWPHRRRRRARSQPGRDVRTKCNCWRGSRRSAASSWLRSTAKPLRSRWQPYEPGVLPRPALRSHPPRSPPVVTSIGARRAPWPRERARRVRETTTSTSWLPHNVWSASVPCVRPYEYHELQRLLDRSRCRARPRPAR